MDVSGPHGWTTSSVNLGRIDEIKLTTKNETQAGLRTVHPLLELRVPFKLPCEELSAIVRGAKDADLSCVTTAAKKIASHEDEAVFDGLKAANIRGIVSSLWYDELIVDKNYENFPTQVATAISLLRSAAFMGRFQ